MKIFKRLKGEVDSFIEWNPFFAFITMFAGAGLIGILGMMCLPETWDPYYQMQETFKRFKDESSYEVIVNNIVDQYADDFEFVFLEDEDIKVAGFEKGLAAETEKGWVLVTPEIVLGDIEGAEILRKGAATMIIISNNEVVALAE